MVNHRYYEIDLSDIWEYEREAFFIHEYSNDYAEGLQAQIRKLIIDTDPQRGLTKGQLNDYTFNKNYKQFQSTDGLIEKEFRLNFFFIGDTYYCYGNKLIIKKSNSNYSYWFALKLRQYESNLFEIDNFLTFQLERYYTNNKSNFTKFLSLLLLQYKDGQLISDKVIQTVQNWIVDFSKGKTDPSTNLELSSPNSFTLLKFQTNPNYLKENTHHFIDILKELKDADFIDKKCNLDHFVAIFSGNIINKTHRVNWTAAIKQLYFFVKLLIDMQKVQKLKIGKWHTTVKCFVVNGEEITSDQVGRPDGKTPLDERLRSIVEKI